jgi:hypothetical protein
MADRSLRSRSASVTRKGVLRPTNSDHESENELTVTENVNIGNGDFQCAEVNVNSVISDNMVESNSASSQVINKHSNVTINTANNTHITAGQLQDMLASLMVTIQAEGDRQRQENSKQMSSLDAKLGKVSADLDIKLNAVSESLNLRISSVVGDMTAEMRKENSKFAATLTERFESENSKLRKEFSSQLQTELKVICSEIETVKNITEVELTNIVRNIEGVYESVHEKVSEHKAYTDSAVDELRTEITQHREKIGHKVDIVTGEIGSVVSSLAECTHQIEAVKQGNEAELLKLNSAIENIEARLNSGQKPITSADKTSPQLTI